MKIEFEIELNKKWIYDNNGETIGETNFVVSNTWLHDLFNKYYAEKYESMEQNNRDELEEKLYSVADKFKEELKEIKASSERDNIDELTSKIVKELNKYYNK